MNSMNIKHQLVPPNIRRANNTDRAMQTFKNHFMAVLCNLDKDFHIQLWDRLLQQAKISLNFLRQSITLLFLSVYTHIIGDFDFNSAPLAPPGT